MNSSLDNWQHDRIVVLIVDDDPVDQHLIELGIREAVRGAECRFAGDGTEALDYLQRASAHSDPDDCPLPDLIFLDLNLPKVGGFGTLRSIRKQPATKDIPVIVLTTSESPDDMAASYRMGANAFITKDAHVSALYASLRGALSFGLATAQAAVR